MSTANKLEKAKKFLDFWFSPWSAAKAARWEFFTYDKPFTEEHAKYIIMCIMAGCEDVSWSALDD